MKRSPYDNTGDDPICGRHGEHLEPFGCPQCAYEDDTKEDKDFESDATPALERTKGHDA